MVGLVDEWAARFFEELDYVNEGENGTLFAEMMKKDLPQVTDNLTSLSISITLTFHLFHLSTPCLAHTNTTRRNRKLRKSDQFRQKKPQA